MFRRASKMLIATTLLLAFERKILSEIAAIPKNGTPDA